MYPRLLVATLWVWIGCTGQLVLQLACVRQSGGAYKAQQPQGQRGDGGLQEFEALLRAPPRGGSRLDARPKLSGRSLAREQSLPSLARPGHSLSRPVVADVPQRSGINGVLKRSGSAVLAGGGASLTSAGRSTSLAGAPPLRPPRNRSRAAGGAQPVGVAAAEARTSDPAWLEAHGYTQIRKRGSGAFGVVYSALRNGRMVAIKVAKDSEMLRALRREREVYATLPTRGFPKMHEFFAEWDRGFLVMDLLGESLVGKSLEGEPQVRKMMAALVERTESLHNAGYMHRDIKPDNLMYGVKDDTLYMVDFGIALKIQADGKYPKDFAGTLKYASRRALAGNLPSPYDDLETLCYVVAELFKGKLPWHGVRGHADVLAAKRRFLEHRGGVRSLFSGWPPYLADAMQDYISMVEELYRTPVPRNLDFDYTKLVYLFK
eukprot:TRINITY_DN56236_c0_g1_i1.p1 TRINITY_DN56236_c0_g1~~TRINITY_DN56236_c0_g1_i1.p1  ORF type:complete len:433 (-),score=54.75 TRINITY_DN56236_c0_g1_i1:203-1501(-)